MSKIWITENQSFLLSLVAVGLVLCGSFLIVLGIYTNNDQESFIGIIICMLFIPYVIIKEVTTHEYGNGYVEESYHCMNGLISTQSIWDGDFTNQNKKLYDELQKEKSV